MEKIIIPLAKTKEVTQGYGILPIPVQEYQIWEALRENIPKEGKYIHHILCQDWTENKDYPKHDFGSWSAPVGDTTFNLHIYWEPK